MSETALRCGMARLDWSQPGGPRAADYGDVYYSVEDGLEETRAVFLQACGLPDAWYGRASYVVGELGFGTGLNALALWDLWRREGNRDGWLHFLSVEKHPLTRADAARALADWPELKPLGDQLLAQWPSALKGAHRLVFAEDRVSITIFHDEAEAALEQIEAEVDCWFLDGFAPAKNDAMWSQAILDQVGRVSAPGARIGTFTVAGAVRRGLQAAGFEVSKQPGFGRKRERLEAVYAGGDRAGGTGVFDRAEPISGRIAVIGAGIAGASLAVALRRRGRDVVLIDPLGPAGGASGAPAGLLTPRLEKADRPHVRATLAAFEFATRFYEGRDGVWDDGVLRRAKDQAEAGRFSEMAALLGEGFDWSDDGLWMSAAKRLAPERLVRDLIGDVPVLARHVTRVEREAAGLRLVSESGQTILDCDAVIHATGHSAGDVLPAITPSAGLLAVLDVDPPAFPVVWGGYVAAAPNGDTLLGASHIRGTDAGAADEVIPALRKSAVDHLGDHAGLASASVLASWSGVRASTPDRLPVCGAVPDQEFETRWAAAARSGRLRLENAADEVPVSRQFCLSGLGSRGFAHAPLLAESLVSELCGEPGALERAGRESFHPARFAWRRLKRGG